MIYPRPQASYAKNQAENHWVIVDDPFLTMEKRTHYSKHPHTLLVMNTVQSECLTVYVDAICPQILQGGSTFGNDLVLLSCNEVA